MQTLDRLRVESPNTPIPIIVPSNAVARRLKVLCASRPAARGALQFEWITMIDAARRIWDAAPPESSLLQPEWKRLMSQALLEKLVQDATGTLRYFSAVSEFDGFVRGLGGCFAELKEAGVTPAMLRGLRKLPPKLDEIRLLFDTYDALLAERNFCEDADLLVRATAEAATSPWLAARPHVLLYGVYDPTPIQRALLEAVMKRAQVWAFVPVEPGHPACRYAERTVAWFRGALGEEMRNSVSSEGVLDELADGIFALEDTRGKDGTASGHAVSDQTVDILSVGGRVEEVEAIADRLLELKAADSSMRWDQMAVFFRMLDPYRATVERVFRKRRIPCAFPGAASAAQHPLAQCVLQLLALEAGEFATDEVLDVLTSPWLDVGRGAARGATDGADPSSWARLARAAGIDGGESWGTGLERLEKLAQRALEDAASAAALRIRVRALFDVCRSRPDAASDAGTHAAPVADWIAWFHRMIALVRLPEPVGPEAASSVDAAAALRAVLNAAQSLWVVADIAERWTYEDALQWFARALEQESGPWSLHGDRVWVSDVMAARGLSFDVVFLGGMVEHGFPRQVQQDPFLLDGERLELSDLLDVAIPPKREPGYQEEKLLFYLTVRAAQRRLYLLYQRVDEEGRDRVPSHYIYEVQRILKERAPHETIPLSRLATGAGRPLGLLTPVERRAVALHCAAQGAEALDVAAAAVRESDDPCLAAALRAEESRWFGAWPDAYDGVVGVSPTLPDAFSPSRLETYGDCPFRYFAQHVLKLEPLPELRQDLDRRDVGTISHNVLCRLFTELREQRRLPIRVEDMEAVLARAEELTQEECDAYASTHPTGLPLLWALEQDTIKRNLFAVLSEPLEEDDAFVPTYFEASFGEAIPEGADSTLSTEKPLTLPLDTGASLRFRGRIDRIDVDASTRRVRVVDYKTGRKKSFKGLLRGEQFQMPIYLMAVEELLLKGWEVEEAVLWFIGRERGASRLSREDWEAARSAVEGAMRRFVGAMGSGMFVPYPGAKHCEVCDYRTICRRSPVSRLERKWGHESVRWYADLKAGAEEDT